MKTRFKTSTKSLNQSILENSNFLNNQNYILGINEKNNIISKYLTKWKIKLFYRILNKILIYIKKLFFILILILYTIFIYKVQRYLEFNWMTLIFILANIALFILIIFHLFISDNIYIIKNIKTYFLNDGKVNLSYILSIFITFILFLSIPVSIYKMMNYYHWYTFEFWEMYIGLFIILFWVIITIGWTSLTAWFTSKIRYFNVLLLPFFLLYTIIFYIYYKIKSYLFKNNFIIIKFNINDKNSENYKIIKTKLKISTKSQKKSIWENSNFLNN